jgi:hypothetical protein
MTIALPCYFTKLWTVWSSQAAGDAWNMCVTVIATSWKSKDASSTDLKRDWPSEAHDVMKGNVMIEY